MTSVIFPPVYDGRSPVDRWLQRFAVCATANGWDAVVQGQKLPAFLEGEALVVYLELPSDKRTLQDVTDALLAAFAPPEGRSEHLLAFERLTLGDGESPRSYLFELKRLLDLAMPKIDTVAREQLLFHHFVNGLPPDIRVAIRTSHECRTSDAALQKALALATVTTVRPGVAATAIDGVASAVHGGAVDLASRLDQLERELARMRTSGSSGGEAVAQNAVAAVTPMLGRRPGAGRHNAAQAFGASRRDAPKGPRCWTCMGFGHLARQCANNAATTNDSQQGRTQGQGNGRGAAAFRGTAGRF